MAAGIFGTSTPFVATKLIAMTHQDKASPAYWLMFGAALGIIRLRPSAGSEHRLRSALGEKLDPDALDGVISMHLIESDPALSRPLADDPPVSDPGAGDWFVLIDATNVNAVSEAIAARFTAPNAFDGGIKISAGSYSLMWDLARSDMGLS